MSLVGENGVNSDLRKVESWGALDVSASMVVGMSCVHDALQQSVKVGMG